MTQHISIVEGDITTATVDAIVNAANPLMLGGGGVDGAIHRAAGAKLLEACRRVKAVNGIRCPVGEARITPAGDLAARYVIHTVGPRYGTDPQPSDLLAAAHRASLTLALENDCRSIAFPAISCGAYRFPPKEAARISIAVCRRTEFADLAIVFYLFDHSMVEIWQAAMAETQLNLPF